MNKEELELYVKKSCENVFKKLAENPEEMLNLSDLQDKYNNLLKEKIELKEQIKKQKEDNQHLHNLNNTIFRKLLNKKYENKKQKEVIDKIENCTNERISKCFKLFRNSTKILESDSPIFDKYCVSITAKRRYIVPLVKYANYYKRVNEISDFAKEKIDEYLNFKTKKYAHLDFDL